MSVTGTMKKGPERRWLNVWSRHGSVTAHETNAGKRYRVIYRKPDHIQTQKRGFTTKRDAELFLVKVEIDKSRGAYVDPAKSRVFGGLA